MESNEAMEYYVTSSLIRSFDQYLSTGLFSMFIRALCSLREMVRAYVPLVNMFRLFLLNRYVHQVLRITNSQ
jgi:hypothetical protein